MVCIPCIIAGGYKALKIACKAIISAYKAACALPGCKRSTTFADAKRGENVTGKCYKLRKIYSSLGCKYVETKPRDKSSQLRMRKAAWNKCKSKVKQYCCGS